MKEPIWISRAVVLATQEELLQRFGGLGGIRDEGLLESDLGRPLHVFACGDPSLVALAASYACGVVKNHPFIDGNKRIGFMTAYIFLEASGLQFQAPEEEVVERTLALAAGAIGEIDYREWLERSCAAG